MSTKHFFPHTEGVVVQGLESLVARNNHLALDAPNKVVFSKTHKPSKVAVISGGGSGHEPAWSGYVGDGMLAAAVNGEVFASPATKQVMAAIKQVPSDVGIILCITNYTGDNLHFGLAREKAEGMGYKIDLLRMTDDVSLGRKKTENTGRRGLAANIFVLKLVGAAASEDYDFDTCMSIGQSVNKHAVTVGSSLDHCHIPGRDHHRAIPQDAYVLGMGIHNEPGLHEIAPMPTAESLVNDMLTYLLDPKDPDRAFVEFQEEDEVLLMINNFGGMSNFELEALTNITRKSLERDWDIVPSRIYAQCFESSLNAPGWSISLVNLSAVSRDIEMPIKTLFNLLDKDTRAPAWPKNGYVHVPPTRGMSQYDADSGIDVLAQKGPVIDATRLEKALRTACEAAIEAEPRITKWDIQMGDGDCGEAVFNICQGIIKKLDAGLCQEGPLFYILDELVEAVEDVGGTLAAILSIMLASFTTSLRQAYNKNESGFTMDAKSAGQAAAAGLKNLLKYTSARQGGRTVMDTLIPFCLTLDSAQNLLTAVGAAELGAKSTAGMKAKFGRATYVGEDADVQQDLPPDPGAMAAAIYLRGFSDALEGHDDSPVPALKVLESGAHVVSHVV